MINFASTSSPVSEQSLQVLLAAVPVAELAWVSSYEDLEADDLSLITQTGVTTNTTAVTVVDAPPVDSDNYQLKSFHTKNQNVAAVTFIIQYNDNATLRELLRVTLNQNDSFTYEQAEGWRVLNSSGAVKISIGGAGSSLLAQVNPLAVTLTDGYTVPSGKKFIGHVNVANRSVATSFRISLAPNGAADNVVQYLAYDLPLSLNNIYDSSEFRIDALDVVRVYTVLATLTFTITGEESDA